MSIKKSIITKTDVPIIVLLSLKCTFNFLF